LEIDKVWTTNCTKNKNWWNFFLNSHNVRMIGTENLWTNLITQIFLMISLKQIVQELCAMRTMQQDETRRERRRGKRSSNVMSQTDSRSPNEGSLIIGREVLLVRNIGIDVLNAGAGS
jgi:hypothetical protein